MEALHIWEVEVFKTFLLVLARFGGLVVAAPVLGSRNFPITAKIGFSALGAMLIVPTLPPLGYPLPEEALPFAMMAAGELLIGMMIGFVMTIVFAAIQVGGQIMDMQTGFGMMNVFNPAMETQFPIFGFFFFILAVLYLMGINGHHLMVRALVSTYEQIPLGGFVVRPALLLEIPQWGSALFLDGLLISAPVCAAMLMAYVTMGLLGRVVPQIQLFVVGFPLTIATGLLITALSLHIYMYTLGGMFERMFRNVEVVIRGLSG